MVVTKQGVSEDIGDGEYLESGTVILRLRTVANVVIICR
jgi:hypothetical protein